MIYKPYDIVVVPFPFADIVATKNRPAIVISKAKIGNLEEKDQKVLRKNLREAFTISQKK